MKRRTTRLFPISRARWIGQRQQVRTRDAPEHSTASTGPNTKKNAVRDLLALNVDVASLLTKDDATYGFDNVGSGGLSPTLLERYLSAAQKISRLATGTPLRTAGASVLVLPADLTQENHLDGLPFGTRGGTIMHYTFPADAEYDIQVRLMRPSSSKRTR